MRTNLRMVCLAAVLAAFCAQSTPVAMADQDPTGGGASLGPNRHAIKGEAPAFNSPTDAKFPPMFPKHGHRKIYEDDRVIVWHEILSTGPALWHKHIRDQITIHLTHGFVQSFNKDGTAQTAWDGDDLGPLPHMGSRLIKAGLLHASRSPDSRQKTNFWIEIKGTEPADCGSWSTAPECAGGKPATQPPSARRAASPKVAPGKKYPPLFPRDGAKNVYEDERFIIWDEELSPGPAVLRMPVRDGFSFHFSHGLVEYTYDDGRKSELLWSDWTEDEYVPTPHIGGVIRAGTPPTGERSADVAKGQRRTFWVEYKGTEPTDCRNWSTDPMCK